MARVEVPIVVINGTTGLPVSGAAVAISFRATGGAATWYTGETGGTGSTAAVVTDTNGRVSAWVERGAYNLTVTGTGITTYTEAWDAAPGGDATVDSTWVATNVVIPGEIKMGGWAAAPTGWLLCDGATVSRATYATLFSAIGTAFGAGDGVSTFKLPDLRGRVPVGAGAGTGLTARTLGATGGAETHTLSAAEAATQAHGHADTFSATTAATNTDHTHNLPATVPAVAGSTWQQISVNSTIGDSIIARVASGTVTNVASTNAQNSNTSHSHTVTVAGAVTNHAGSAATGAHNNMQPHQAVSFIIKT